MNQSRTGGSPVTPSSRARQSAPINPWLVWNQARYPGVQTCDCHDRCAQIKDSHDPAWLIRVISWPDSQKTVVAAAGRRLRVLASIPRHHRKEAA